MATHVIYPDADPESNSVDGRVNHASAAGLTWANMLAAAGSGSSAGTPSPAIGLGWQCHDTDTDEWKSLYRGIFLFYDATLTGTPLSGTLSIAGNTKQDNASCSPTAVIVSSNPASDTALQNSDFATLGSTALSDEIAYTNWTTGNSAYNDFTLNASGLAAIGTLSKFGIKSGFELSGQPAWVANQWTNWNFNWADTAGTSIDPKLTVITQASSPIIIII